VSDIDTAVVDGLKALDPNRPIREADIIAHSSLVSAIEIALIAGAANTTAGNIATHATSQDSNQWLKNCTGFGDGKLAIPAAIKLVSPA
jgi:hypothetical protein